MNTQELEQTLNEQYPDLRIVNIRYNADKPHAYAMCAGKNHWPECLKTVDGGKNWELLRIKGISGEKKGY